PRRWREPRSPAAPPPGYRQGAPRATDSAPPRPPATPILPPPPSPPSPAASTPFAPQSGAALVDEVLPPIRWVVPGILPEGALVLGGRPKGGKSLLLLQASVELVEGFPVWGHFPAERCGALYLALEDGKRRLQSRLRWLMGNGRPKNWHYLNQAPLLTQGLVREMEAWLDAHPDVRLVVIDTLTRVRQRGQGRGSNYEIDYDSVAPFSELGQ